MSISNKRPKNSPCFLFLKLDEVFANLEKKSKKMITAIVKYALSISTKENKQI